MEIQRESRIVVMGGSFNPPTIAHLRLMDAAIQAIGAERGIFIPVGEAYLKRKLRKSEFPIRLSEQLRLDMLRAMCAGRENLTVSDLEYRNPQLYTKDTMHLLQQMYPSSRLFFLAGADKLKLLGSLAEKTDFLAHFGVVLFSREGVDAENVLRQDERFSPFVQAFVHVRQPQGVDGISSTIVRRLIIAGQAERAEPYLHRDVWEMIRHLSAEDFPQEIERFKGAYEFLSSSYPSPVSYDGLSFSCAEAAFQAARCVLIGDRKRIAQGDGNRAKALAAMIEPGPDWEERKLSVMEAVQRAKFTQNPELARKLTDTGNAVLIYGTNGKERFWGKDLYSDQGENHLGRLLMKLRVEIQHEMERDKE